MDYKDIKSIKELNEVVENQQAVLAYFSHHHCNVCKVLKPKVSEMIANHFPQVSLYYINTLQQPESAAQYTVFTVPTILVFFEGKEYVRESRHVGLDKFHERLEKLYRIYFS